MKMVDMWDNHPLSMWNIITLIRFTTILQPDHAPHHDITNTIFEVSTLVSTTYTISTAIVVVGDARAEKYKFVKGSVNMYNNSFSANPLFSFVENFFKTWLNQWVVSFQHRFLYFKKVNVSRKISFFAQTIHLAVKQNNKVKVEEIDAKLSLDMQLSVTVGWPNNPGPFILSQLV